MNELRNPCASRRASLRGGRVAALSVVIGLTATALSSASALAGAMETAPAREPVEIELRLESGLLAYDLAWSDHTDAARAELAAQAIEQMTDPATPYVLKIPQLPVVWRPLPAGFSSAHSSRATRGSRRRAIRMRSSGLEDMDGQPIDRAKARLGRIHYERDMQAALVDVIDQIRAARPGALLTIDQFIPPESFGAQAGSYTDLLADLNFVVVHMPSARSTSTRHRGLSRRARARVMEATSTNTLDLDRTFKMASAPDGMFVLVEQDGRWSAVDDGPLPDGILNDSADSGNTEWVDPTGDVSGDNVGGDSLGAGATNHAPGVTTGDGPPIVIDPNDKTSNNDPVDQTFGFNGHGDRAGDGPPPDVGGGIDPPPPPTDNSGDDNADNSGNDNADDSGNDNADNSGNDNADNSGNDNADNSGDDNADNDGGTDPPPTDGSGDNGSSSSDVPTVGQVLTPGAGFAGVTPMPAPVGSGHGADAEAIARWDVAPFQDFTGSFTIGVVAFHINGIDRVEFSVDGGPWAPVYDMILNPRTDVWEYTVTLDAARFDDGPVEVRAIAYPSVGVPRVLQGAVTTESIRSGEFSLSLFALGSASKNQDVQYVSPGGSDTSGDGSAQAPLRTIGAAVRAIQSSRGDAEVGGGMVYLMPGDHMYGSYTPPLPRTRDRWLTIASAPTARRADVRIVGSGPGAMRVGMVHFRDLTIAAEIRSDGDGTGRGETAWIDHCIIEGTGPDEGLRFWFSAHDWSRGVYMTDCTVQNLTTGVLPTAMQRNTKTHDIGGDAYRNASMLVNCSAANLVSGTNFHNDVVQWFGGGMDNVIVYNLVAVDNIHGQGIFSRGFPTHPDNKNFALVNVLINAPRNMSQFQKTTKHLLLWNVTANNFAFRIGEDQKPASYPNISIHNCVFRKLWYRASADVDASDNHYIVDSDSALVGAHYTIGDPGWMDPAHNDFRPGPNSVLRGRVRTPRVPIDATNAHVPQTSSDIGALQSSGAPIPPITP